LARRALLPDTDAYADPITGRVELAGESIPQTGLDACPHRP